MPTYHPYVFDAKQRKFVGRFEQMYQAEAAEGFDSWHERDMRPLRKTVSQAILNSYNFSRILDLGCGKGTFTHLLKKPNNRVLGVDASRTAIRRAQASFPDVEFRCMDIHKVSSLRQRFDLVVVMCTFAYIEAWPKLIPMIAPMTRWLFVAEYIPPDPIGFVKSPAELIAQVRRSFTIRTKVVLDDAHCLLLAESRVSAKRRRA